MSKIFPLGVLAGAFLLTACVNHTQPEQLPAQWIGESQWRYAEGNATAALDAQWWQYFNSPTLSRYIQQAQTQNSDVLIAAERVRQAELQLNIANASLFPQLNAGISSGKKNSANDNGPSSAGESTNLSVNASYEIDLWGGIAASRRVAKYDYQASVFTADMQRLSINAAVATTWFNYVAVQQRMKTAQQSLLLAQRLQNIVASRYRNGVASAADVAQQQTILLNQQAALLPLQLLSDQTSAALALLLGQTPQSFTPEIEDFSAITVPPIAVALPTEVLSRRPDMAISEAQLQAAAADVVTARAALLPSGQLAASAGRASAALFSLNPALETHGWTVSLAQTIFAGGALKNRLQLSQSRRLELVENYRLTTLNALAEVDNALNAVANYQRQEIIQQDIVAQAQRGLRLNEIAYREGAADLQALLNSQRSLFQAEDALVQQHTERLQAAVDLYKALGGGWQRPSN